VPALRNLYRNLHQKPSKHRKHRKPSKFTFAATGTAALATIAVGSGAAIAAPEGPVSHAASSRPAARTAPDSGAMTDAAVEVAGAKIHLAKVEVRKKVEAARRAAARRAAKRREAAQRAAERAAARQAAQQQQQQQQQSGAAGGSATPSGSPQQIAMGMLGSYGWSSGEFGCLQSLWDAESGWNPTASNPTSGAYGIPQALPGSKMASAGADWQTNPATQIRWGLGYIQQVYGSPCGAWSHFQAAGSY
jgi:hypothetical protein